MFCYLHKDDNFKLNLEPLFSEVMNGVEEIMFLELTKSWRAIFGFKKLNKKNISSVVYNLNFHHCDCRPLGNHLGFINALQLIFLILITIQKMFKSIHDNKLKVSLVFYYIQQSYVSYCVVQN